MSKFNLRDALEPVRQKYKTYALDVCDLIVGMLPRRRAGPVLLLVRVDAIGDFIMWLPYARHYRQTYPDHRIVLVANKEWAELARRFLYWDEVMPLDAGIIRNQLGYRARTFAAIRRLAAGVAIQPTYSRYLYIGDSIVRASGAPVRIGADSDDLSNISAAQKQRSDRWYTKLLPQTADGRTEIDHNRNFIARLAPGALDALDAEPYRLPAVAALPDRLVPAGPYFIVFPGASWRGKRWQEASFAALAKQVARETGWQPVLCGSGKEWDICQDVAAQAASGDMPVTMLNWAGKTSLAEFCEVVRGARLLVANDTSAIHIAAAVGVPSVCIVGGGHFGRFLPYPDTAAVRHPQVVNEFMPCYGCNWVCSQPHRVEDPYPCVSAISVERTLDAIRVAMGAPTPNPWPVHEAPQSATP